MGEIAFEQSVCQAAEAAGWMVRKMVYPNRRGCPDRWFFRDGEVRIIEFKRPGQRETPQQRREHGRYSLHGFPVYVVASWAAARTVLGVLEP